MSHTDKTDPWSVRVSFRAAWLVAAHDHRDGVCDLPPVPCLSPWRAGACRWVESSRAWYEAGPLCGCSWCSGSFLYRRRLRADRRRARLQARDAARQFNVSGDALDF